MKQQKKIKDAKSKNRGVIIVISAIMLGLLMITLFAFDINNSIKKNIVVYNQSQDILANTMLKSAAIQLQEDSGSFEERVITNIEIEFPTSSSTYCILAKEDDIVFLKDRNTTSTLLDEKLSTYFDTDNICSRDKQQYILSSSETVFNGQTYTFVIGIKKNYFMKKIQFNEMRLHAVGYFGVYSVLLLTIIIAAFYKMKSNDKRIVRLESELASNRIMIDKLENEKNNRYINSNDASVYSFYPRTVIEKVISMMTDDEKIIAAQIDISVTKLKIEHFIFISTILGRTMSKGSIACYWRDNCFKLIMFDASREKIEKFIDEFIAKYQNECEEKVDELRIVATRLVGGDE